MPEPYRFNGPPQRFRQDQWDLLQRLVEEHDQIEIELIVDLPAIGGYGYDEAVAAMQEKLRSVLTERIGRRVEVEPTTRSGGPAANCGFRIS